MNRGYRGEFLSHESVFVEGKGAVLRWKRRAGHTAVSACVGLVWSSVLRLEGKIEVMLLGEIKLVLCTGCFVCFILLFEDNEE